LPLSDLHCSTHCTGVVSQLCDVVDVYGFGVKGMGNCHHCGYSKTDDEREKTQKFVYHYYKVNPLSLSLRRR
jgi:hypothetical protein